MLKTGWKLQLNLMWAGQTLLIAMMAMSLPYWPLYIAKLGDFTPQELRFWSAAIYIAPFVTAMFSSPIWGKLGDKYGYKLMVIRACLGLFVTQTLILCSSNVVMIFIFRLLEGALAGFIVAAQSWSIAISPDSERSSTIGKLQSATAIGNLIGPLLGGIIATYGGYQSIFKGSSIICAVVTITFLFFLQNTNNSGFESSKNPNSLSLNSSTSQKSSRFSYFQKQLFSILLVIILIQLARQMITPVFSLFVTEKLGGTDITVGLLYAATGLMIFITAPMWGKFFDSIVQENHSISLIVAILLFACSGLQILHAYADTAASVFILRLGWGICLGAMLPVLLRLLLDHGSKDQHGFFLGLGNGATKFGNLLGIITGALVEAQLGYANSFLATSMLYAFAGILVLLNTNPFKKKIISYDQ
jgi:MFS family permease